MLKVCLQACPDPNIEVEHIVFRMPSEWRSSDPTKKMIHDLMQKCAAKFQPLQLYKQIIVYAPNVLICVNVC